VVSEIVVDTQDPMIANLLFPVTMVLTKTKQHIIYLSYTIGMQKIDDTIYISNLPQEVTEEALAAHFGSIGIIKTDKKLKKLKSKFGHFNGGRPN
jgi:RNA recognition motif-containing protein